MWSASVSNYTANELPDPTIFKFLFEMSLRIRFFLRIRKSGIIF